MKGIETGGELKESVPTGAVLEILVQAQVGAAEGRHCSGSLKVWSKPAGPGSQRAQIIGSSSQWVLLRKDSLECRGTDIILKPACLRGH